MSMSKKSEKRGKSLIERWFEDEDGFGLADGSPIPDDGEDDSDDDGKAHITDGLADGGEGSGNFNHAGRPGEVGGSAPSESAPSTSTPKPRFSMLSDEDRKAIETIKKNGFMPFGLSDEQQEESTQRLLKHLNEAGIKVEQDPDGGWNDYKVAANGLSLEEVRTLERALGFRYFGGTNAEEYVAQCKAIGQKPDLHMEPLEIPQGMLKKSDGIPVYKNLDDREVLSADEILEYNADKMRDGFGEEAHKKITESAAKAAEAWTPEQYKAVNDYTRQFGGYNYMDVNEYLVSGEGSEGAKKAAEEITNALDHEIGEKCLTYRGINANGITHITDNPNAAKYIAQIEKGNFGNAKKLADIIKGTTVTNPAVMSTSLNQNSDYGRLPIQMLFKTPANAKAVDISSASAFGGGRSEVEKKLAAMLGMPMSYEHEIAYKPNTKYKIDDVHFSLLSAGKGEKPRGQIVLTCSVLPD